MTAADRRVRSAPREVGGLPPQRGPRAGETWEGTSVDGAAIEAALAQLWTQAGHRPEGGPRQPPLPTYLWWIGAVPYEAELFRHMVDLCDRLIVDSGFFARPVEGLAQLAAHQQRTAGDRGVGDVHWMRLTPWRNLAAQFFDGAELRPYASCIDSVRLGYTHDEQTHGGLGQALLLAGWLTSCLGWSPRPRAARRHGDTVYLEAERPAVGRSGTVAIDVGPAVRVPRPAASADPDGLVSLRMTAMLHGVPGVFAMERRPQSFEVTTTTMIGGVQGAARTLSRVARL